MFVLDDFRNRSHRVEQWGIASKLAPTWVCSQSKPTVPVGIFWAAAEQLLFYWGNVTFCEPLIVRGLSMVPGHLLFSGLRSSLCRTQTIAPS